MKKFVIVLLCLMLLCPTALANSWGLKGELVSAVSADKRWNDYRRIGNQSGNAAVMHSRYHNALMMVEDGTLKVYTTAVYQPEAKKGNPTITLENGQLTIAYGAEHFYFAKQGGMWVLTGSWAGIGLSQDGWGYQASSDEGTAQLSQRITLEDFNINLHPRTLDEVRRLNENLAALDSGVDVLNASPELYPKSSDKLPVYSAPFGEDAWRAADGKAAVSLRGDTWYLGGYTNADGERYDCVKYDVSARTQRIGYIVSEEGGPPTSNWIHVNVVATEKTYLTDDPDVSQYAQFTVPKGTQLTCMGTYGGDYAYVAGEVKKGKFVDGGQIVWGFVPLKHIQPEAQNLGADAMAPFVGQWKYSAGGSMGPNDLTLNADGTFVGDGETGTWYLRQYAPSENKYWAEVPYELVLAYDDGRVNIKGMYVGDDAFSLLNWEGSGGYERAVEADQEANG